MADWGYPPILEETANTMGQIMGYNELLYINNTYQFSEPVPIRLQPDTRNTWIFPMLILWISYLKEPSGGVTVTTS